MVDATLNDIGILADGTVLNPPPIPALPYAAVLVTFQANIPGFEPTTAVIAPRMVQKMVRKVQDEGRMVNGAWVPKYSGMTDLFMRHIKDTLFSDLDATYSDADPQLAELEAQVEARRAALQNQPVFLES